MKKILVLGVIVFAAMVSQASYLYWQVQYSDASQFESPEGLAVNTATLYAVKGDDKKEIDWADIDAKAVPAMKDIGWYNLGDLTDAGDYSFYVELANYNAETQDYKSLAVGQTLKYSELDAAGYILPTLMAIAPAWSGGTYNVPEPTSGLLVLLGLASLALKRKSVS